MENNRIDKEGKEEIRELLITHQGKEIDLENTPEPMTKGTRKLTDAQRRLALLQATAPFHKMTFIEQCTLAGFSRAAGYKALKNKSFQLYIEEILDAQNRQFMSTVYAKLQGIITTSRSEKVQLDAIKVYLTMTGKLTEFKEVSHKVQMEAQEVRAKRLDELEAEILEMEKELLEDPHEK